MNGNAQPETIFGQAIQMATTEDRAAFLEQACRHDPMLRRQVQKLVDDYFRAGDFLERPLAQMDAPIVEPHVFGGVGDQIGPYKLREQIGEGGMGVVYVAEQSEPIRRKVALKIIRPGMASQDVVARFEAERQALAMMDHPHIARVFDAGTTEAGQPYFVMELVQGLPITEYCDQHRQSTRDRLELFLKVCQAVQHAHQKGIIHRDIKPSNILVPRIDGAAVPKVIDFGVAKAVRHKLTEPTVYTRFSQMVGTPLYMSPEQTELGVVDIDTRSDVYSLGVVLYELLTGVTPFDQEQVNRAGFDEMRRMIREVDPPRPSHRVTTLDAGALSTASAQRGLDGRQLARILRGELDWIVMKALEKDRARRYESPGALALDVQRYLRNEPIEACPPSRRYQLRKMIVRHKSFFGATAVVIVALSVGVIATSWEAMVATRAKNRAETAEAEAVAAKELAVAAEERASRHLQGALDAVDQMLSRVGDKKLENIPLMEQVRYELLEDAVRLYDRFLADAPHDPQLQTETAITERRKARVLRLLGRSDEAREPIERSIRLLRERLDDARDSEPLQLELARSLLLAGPILQQLPPLEEAVAMLRQVDSASESHRDAIMELGFALSTIALEAEKLGDPGRAQETYAEAERAFAEILPRYPDDHALRRAYAKHLMNFGTLLQHQGDWKVYEEKANKAVDIGRSLTSSQRQAEDIHVLAVALLNRGATRRSRVIASSSEGPAEDRPQPDYTEADHDLREAIDLLRELVRDYPAVPLYRERLASTLTIRLGVGLDPELAIDAGNEAVQIMRSLTEDFPTIVEYRRTYAGALSNVAYTLWKQDRELERAAQLTRQAIEQQTHVLKANAEDPTANHFLANHYAVLADILSKQGNKPLDVIDTCDCGLQVAERLSQRYPDNQSFSSLRREFEEKKQAAELAMRQGDGVDGNSTNPVHE